MAYDERYDMSPYAMAKGESVVETTQKLLNGLPFDLKDIVGNIGVNGEPYKGSSN